MEKKSLLKTRKVTGIFSLAAFIGGFLFLNPTITGGAILENSSSLSSLSIIGLLLIACSVILAAYALKKR